MLEIIKRHLPIGWLNYYRAIKKLFVAPKFERDCLSNVFTEIIRRNYWQGEDSLCGTTSGAEATVKMRESLHQLFKDLGIRSVLDIPCGDFVWMKEMDLTGIQYTGADIVETLITENHRRYAAPNVRFERLDVTADELPKSDLVICRDCLVHLSFDNIQKSLANIKNSGSTWLLCTSFTQNQFNYDIIDGHWRTLNMQKSPFRFHRPERSITDNTLLERSVYRDKSLCLWKLSDVFA